MELESARLSTVRPSKGPERSIRADGDYVVYWMLAQRRTRHNFGLEHAASRARELGKPLLVVEALSCSYRWAADRHHAFVIEGMRANGAALAERGVAYYPYVEPAKGSGQGLHAAIAERACLYVTDHWPCFHMPKWAALVADAIDVPMESVDSCGILPVRLAQKAFARAYDFRRHVHRAAFDSLQSIPLEDPLLERPGGKTQTASELLPGTVLESWPPTDLSAVDLANLPIDHAVPAVPSRPGGQDEARRVLDRFITSRLGNYLDRNQPEADAASGLSPWLHWGHISPHEVFLRVADVEGWDPSSIEGQKATAKREGWWGMSAAAEGFMDELVTWREVCFNTCQERPRDYGKYDALPDFAKKTLEEHAGDRRPSV